MADVESPGPSQLSRRRFLGAALGATAALPAIARQAGAQAKPTITYWNGLTGADGKVMDELNDQFTRETGIKVEQQRIQWADLYAKLQVSVPAGEGPDLALIHLVEIPTSRATGSSIRSTRANWARRAFAARTTSRRRGRAASSRGSATRSRSTSRSTSSTST